MSDALAFSEHDHRGCRVRVEAALDAAARARGFRVTPARRRVLTILTESHRALGAYEILERLSAEGLGRQPPAVYRALDFLIAEGFVHRVERLNAYVACCRPGEDHDGCLLVCRSCRLVAEVEDPGLGLAVAEAAAANDFAMGGGVVEIHGTCPACRRA